MALLHHADLRPTKLELLDAWLPTRRWYPVPADGGFARVAAFRFDDPGGEVGIETMLVRSGTGPVVQVPLTYRGAPLDGREEWLIGTTDHSVLGPRWVYDGCGDPVYSAALARCLFGGGGQAEQFIAGDDGLELREPSMSIEVGEAPGEVPAAGDDIRVTDSDPAVILDGSVELTVVRVLSGDALVVGDGPMLHGMWTVGDPPILLAYGRIS